MGPPLLLRPLYGEGFPERAAELARQAGARVAMDLASFEVVRRYRARLHALLDSGAVDALFGNDDEAAELLAETAPGDPLVRPASQGAVAAAVEAIRRRCAVAVVSYPGGEGMRGLHGGGDGDGARVVRHSG